jgi:hypothetical protein
MKMMVKICRHSYWLIIDSQANAFSTTLLILQWHVILNNCSSQTGGLLILSKSLELGGEAFNVLGFNSHYKPHLPQPLCLVSSQRVC